MINKRLATVGLLLVIALCAPVISASSIESKQQSSDYSPVESTPKDKQPEAAVAAPSIEAKKSEPQHESSAEKQSTEPASENVTRKAKSAGESAAAAAATEPKPAEEKPAEKLSTPAPAAASEPAAKAAKPSASKAAAAQKQSSLSGKSGASTKNNKLPANLGTVTSTGSGGASHYMSKHDAYSAIAEKHGALAHDAMRKSDKRHMHSGGGNPFSSSIQKASGLGEMLNPFKGVSDSGLARTLGASMRSIMKGKYSVPAYVASALLGAVALMAFYESPISPLPVPALPNPPVGRFPPEMPNISPGVQVPFRTNQQQQQPQWGQQQQNYNQRSLNAQQPQQQQQQQVFFPGNSGPQQRQMTTSGSSPVQSLAANLLASVGGKPQQNAQRKSGVDYDPSTSRSLFGNNSPFAAPQKASSSASSNHQQRQSNAFLSFFGLGGSGDQHSAGGHQMSGSSHLESKGTNQNSQAAASVLSNSHVVNKVKSYFRAPNSAGTSSSAGVSNFNPYDQYQRMSFVQALMKDTAFLPGFLTPGNRKSSVAPSSAASSSAATAAAASKPSESSSSAANPPAAAARMQVGNEGQLPMKQQQGGKSAGSGSYGIVKVAHALLESFGSGIAQRGGQPSERKSSSPSEEQHQSIAAATSLLSDLVSGYTGSGADQQQQHHPQQHQEAQQQQQQQSVQSQQQQQVSSGAQQSAQPQQQQQHQSQQHSDAPQTAQARSDEEPQIITADDLKDFSRDEKPAAGLVRKTRSVGFEYPIENYNEVQQPSRAAQINNVIDFVADSYANNRMLFNFVMNQVGLSQAVPYVEQILAPPKDSQ